MKEEEIIKETMEETIEDILFSRFLDTPDRRVLLDEALKLFVDKLKRKRKEENEKR